MIKSFVILTFLFFAKNVNAQVISLNTITTPAIINGVGSLNPDILIGSNVIVTDNQGSICPNVSYEWQSATNESFTQNLVTNLAATKDYDPDVLIVTTYFRRVVSIKCTTPEREAISKCSGIKITIN